MPATRDPRTAPRRTLSGPGAGRLVWLAGAGVALLAAVELHAHRASRADYPAAPAAGPGDGEDVVLVLGFRSPMRGGTNFLQRWRVRIAARSAPAGALFVFSGGVVHGTHAEAAVMAAHAVAAEGLAPERITLELAATSTRENLILSLPWLEGAHTIRIASNTFHARRARRYLRELDPALFARLRPTRDFVPLELGPLRLALTIYDAVAAHVAARRDG